MLINVFPRPPRPNIFYQAGRNSIFFTESGWSSLIFSYAPNNFFIYFNICRFFAFRSVVILSSFFIHVVNIVLISASKQMRRIIAWSHVALMANDHPFRDWPDGQFICHSMRLTKFVTITESAISGSADSSFPQPTFIILPYIHHSPESLGHSWFRGAGSGTKASPRTEPLCLRLSGKRLVAFLTQTYDRIVHVCLQTGKCGQGRASVAALVLARTFYHLGPRYGIEVMT